MRWVCVSEELYLLYANCIYMHSGSCWRFRCKDTMMNTDCLDIATEAQPAIEAMEALAQGRFTPEEIASLLRLRAWYQIEEDRQTGEADRSGQETGQDEPTMTRQRHVGLLLIVISAVSFGVMPVFARIAYAAGAD